MTTDMFGLSQSQSRLSFLVHDLSFIMS